jgi:hypothetical protein
MNFCLLLLEDFFGTRKKRSACSSSTDSPFSLFYFLLSFHVRDPDSVFMTQPIVSAEVRVKRQDDDDEVNVEELCQDRPGDEYFRLSADGDCRDVVR